MEEIRLEQTRRGLPAIWEEGGGLSNTGSAQIIAGAGGEPLVPIYVRRRGDLAGGHHALFVVRPGIVVIEARHHRGDFTIKVWRVRQVTEPHDWEHQTEKYPGAVLDLLADYSDGEWVPEFPEFAASAIEAAMKKAACYHCRRPHYCIEPPNEIIPKSGNAATA